MFCKPQWNKYFLSFLHFFQLPWFPTKFLYNGCKEIEFGIAPLNSYLTRVVMTQKRITVSFLTQTLVRVCIEVVLLLWFVDCNFSPSWLYNSLFMNLFYAIRKLVPFQRSIMMHINQFHDLFSIQQDCFSKIRIPADEQISQKLKCTFCYYTNFTFVPLKLFNNR